MSSGSRPVSEADAVRVRVSYDQPNTTPPVFVAGSFNSWEAVELEARLLDNNQYQFEKYFVLKPGTYQYKFRIGWGDWWVCDASKPEDTDSCGNVNNTLLVASPNTRGNGAHPVGATEAWLAASNKADDTVLAVNSAPIEESSVAQMADCDPAEIIPEPTKGEQQPDEKNAQVSEKNLELPEGTPSQQADEAALARIQSESTKSENQSLGSSEQPHAGNPEQDGNWTGPVMDGKGSAQGDSEYKKEAQVQGAEAPGIEAHGGEQQGPSLESSRAVYVPRQVEPITKVEEDPETDEGWLIRLCRAVLGTVFGSLASIFYGKQRRIFAMALTAAIIPLIAWTLRE